MISYSGSEVLDFQRFPSFQPTRRYGRHLGCRTRSQNTIMEEDHARNITFKFGPIWQITAAGQVMANTHLSIWDIVLRLFSVFCRLSKTSIIKYRLKTRYAFKFLSPFCWIKALICWRYYWVWGLSDNKTIYNTEY